MRRSCFVSSLVLTSLLGLTSLGCSGDDNGNNDPAIKPLVIPEGCNPIAAEHDCMLPYPSDFFLQPDASMPSGKRVVLTEQAKPKTAAEKSFDFTTDNPIDGFSTHQPIMAYFSKGVTAEGVVFHSDDPAKSVGPESKVLLIDAATGKAVPVWGEVDMNAAEPSERAFIVRPFSKLEYKKRYIVALQGLFSANEDGSSGPLAAAPEGFARIRDKNLAVDPALEPIAERYEKEIFPALAALGVSRDKLQLVWDFTTGSEEHLTQDLLFMRDAIIAQFEATPPKVTVTKATENTVEQNENIWLRIEGTLRVPLFLESTELGAKLARDASGKVKQNGETEVTFTLQVPHSANPTDANFEPMRILEYGHGAFGLQEEINYSFMRGFTNQEKYIAAAVDWWGMTEPDRNTVIEKGLNDQSHMFDFVDRLHQGIVNFIALSYALKGPIAELPELKRFDKTLYDKEKLYYYGISQGAIFGVTMLSLNPLLDRGVLGVGGGPYSLMMARSGSFVPFFSLLQSPLQSPLTMAKLIMMSQNRWDRVDPATYATHLLDNPFPKSPANRHILMQNAIGDHLVNNLASDVVSRAAGIKMLEGASAPIWGIDTIAGPADDALVNVDYKLAELPGVYCKLPSPDQEPEVHEQVRRNPKIKAQLNAFFQPNGMITNTCEGICDPE